MRPQSEYMEMVEVGTGTWLRRRWRGRLLALLPLLFVAVILAVTLPTLGDTRLSEGQGPGVTAGMGLLSLLLFFLTPLRFAWRMWRAGVWIDSTEVVIRGPLRTWRIPHHESAEFEPGVQYSLVPWYPVLQALPAPVLRRPGRSPVGAWALANDFSNTGRHDRELQPLCDRLNQALAAVRDGQEPSLGSSSSTSSAVPSMS